MCYFYCELHMQAPLLSSRETLDGMDSLKWIATFHTVTSIEMSQEIPAIAVSSSFFKRATLYCPWDFEHRSSSLETKHRNILYDCIRGVSQRLGLLEGFEMYENMVCYLRRFHWGLDRGPVNLYRQNQQKPRLSSEANCNVQSTVFSRYLKNYIWYSPAKRQKLRNLQKNGCSFRSYYIKLCWLVYVNLI